MRSPTRTEPYAAASDFAADLRVMAESLERAWRRPARRWPPAPADPRRRGLRLPSGAHRPAPELPDVHERSVGELLAKAGVCLALRKLPEEARIGLLLTEIASPRPLHSPHAEYFGRDRRRTGDLLRAKELRGKYGDAALPNCIISKTDGVSDLLEVALLLKEAGLLQPASRPNSR